MLVFAVELQIVRTTCISCDFLGRIGASFKAACTWKVQESIEKFVFMEFTSR